MHLTTTTSTALAQPADQVFGNQVLKVSRVEAEPVRDVILLFRCVLDLSASGRRSAQIALDATQNTQEIALCR